MKESSALGIKIKDAQHAMCCNFQVNELAALLTPMGFLGALALELGGGHLFRDFVLSISAANYS